MSNPFLAIAATMVITPGAGFVLFVSTALARGRSAAIAMASGIVSGTVIIATAVVVGFPAVRAFVPQIVIPLRVLGGLYLALLGVKNLRARGLSVESTASGTGTVERWQPIYAAGIGSALTNPGLLVMYLTLLPGFVPLEAPWTRSSLILASQHVGMVAAWYALLFITVTRLGAHFATTRRQRVVLIFSGVMLIALGLRTATTGMFH